MNVAAKFGMDVDITAEYAKALSMFEGIPDMVASQVPPMPQNNPVQPPMATEPPQGMPTDQSAPQSPEMA
jgi:hypothetical protein